MKTNENENRVFFLQCFVNDPSKASDGCSTSKASINLFEFAFNR